MHDLIASQKKPPQKRGDWRWRVAGDLQGHLFAKLARQRHGNSQARRTTPPGRPPLPPARDMGKKKSKSSGSGADGDDCMPSKSPADAVRHETLDAMSARHEVNTKP